MENKIIEILKRIEDFRVKLSSGEIQGGSDWIVRKCQAEIADGFFECRSDWTKLLRLEEKAKIAFYDGEGSEILTEQFPNGCTLEEAINYFIENPEQVERYV